MSSSVVFDYRALRLLIGIIAFMLPVIVVIWSSTEMPSISASYYTEARDAFVGMLFIVGAFLWAYNGHTLLQSALSKIASLAALGVAIFPTASDACETGIVSVLHAVSALTLFCILAYFCYGPFRLTTRGQPGKKGLRSKIYFVCGTVIVLSMLAIIVAKLSLPDEVYSSLRITYWGEFAALWAFGVAWMVSGKSLQLFAEEAEQYHMLSKLGSDRNNR